MSEKKKNYGRQAADRLPPTNTIDIMFGAWLFFCLCTSNILTKSRTKYLAINLMYKKEYDLALTPDYPNQTSGTKSSLSLFHFRADTNIIILCTKLRVNQTSRFWDMARQREHRDNITSQLGSS